MKFSKFPVSIKTQLMKGAQDPVWKNGQKLLLRFIFLYLILYVYPYGFEYLKGIDFEAWSFWKKPTIWFGEVFLGWEFNPERLSNGFDSKYDYSRFLLIALIAVLGSILWVFIDSKFRKEYNHTLKVLLQTILRYHVGFTLILYGLAKVFLLQFGVMDIEKLESTIGDQNGMRFLWAFMSYSKVYTIAAGLLEVIGGMLLLFRRTAFMGAFLTFITMTHVVLLDIGYDVRVKMFAIHLLLMTFILMADHAKRIYSFFIQNKTPEPMAYLPLFSQKRSKKMGYFLKGVLLLFITALLSQDMNKRIQDQHTLKFPNLRSAHDIEIFVQNGDTLPAGETHEYRWKKLYINGLSYLPETMLLIKENDVPLRFNFTADTIAKKIHFTHLNLEDQKPYEFSYEEFDTNAYLFQGIFEGDTLRIHTRARKYEDYPLMKRKMRWITDLNR